MKRLSTLAFAAFLLVGLGACATSDPKYGVGNYVDDATVTARVKAALLNTAGVNSTAVNVETRQGVVQLSGFVDSRDMAQRAVDAAQRVGGVKSVKNDMRFKGSS
jgi:osmotically-inducible protein OsmY